MPRRYRPDGTALWNGKNPEEFSEADVYRFMAETEEVLQKRELLGGESDAKSIAQRLADGLRDRGYAIHVEHRDLKQEASR